MTIRTITAAMALGLAALGGVALAHEDVKNEAVKARMMLMEDIKDAVGILGGMAKGEVAFDAARADAAKEALISHAARIPEMFEAEEMDPKSEAKPEIWENWSDYVNKAEALGVAAGELDTSDVAWMGPGMGKIGGACKACHEDYRVKK